MDQTVQKLEFSRPVDVSAVPGEGFDISVEATPAERRALCRRFELEALHTLAAELRIAPARGVDGTPTIRVQGLLHARVTQICVVTLEPFPVDVEDNFTALFQLAANLPEAASAADEVMREDSPEPLEMPEIDLGELVAQHLALALDPYPRRPGAAVDLGDGAAGSVDLAPPPHSPFAKLGQLKHKM